MGFKERLCSLLALRSQALEMEDEALALWLTARDGLVNIAIIVCLCNIVEVWQGVDFYFENANVGSFLTKRMFVPSNFSSLEDERHVGLQLPVYYDIATIPMVWDWLGTNIVPVFAETAPRVLVSNHLLGKVRLRQLRVRGNTCSMREVLEGVFAECYGPYSHANENKESFGPGGSSAWEWSSPQSLGGSTFSGEVATYGGGGFYADLPRDRNKAEALLRQLRDGKWLDEASRMLFVDINLYNPDCNVFVLVNLLIEMPPTAGLLPSVSVNTLKLLDDERCRVAPHLLLLALSLWTALALAADLAFRGWKDFCLSFITNGMHCVATLVGLAVAVVGIVRNCREPSLDTDPALQALRSKEFVDLMTASYSYDLYRYSTIVLLAISSGRLLFLSDFGSHSKLTTTLNRSLSDIVTFSFMFTILMFSFSMLAYLVFGADLYDFRTFWHSLFVLIEVIIGQLDYMSLTTTNRYLGPFFYMAFIFFVVFVLYNMFIVILNDTYFVVQEEAAAAKTRTMYEVLPFVVHCLKNVWVLLHLRSPPDCSGVAGGRAAPGRVVRLRALRTLLLDFKIPRPAVTEFMRRVRSSGISGHIDKDEAAVLAKHATEDLWQEPASWDYFMNLSQRLREVERSVRVLDKALDELMLDLR